MWIINNGRAKINAKRFQSGYCTDFAFHSTHPSTVAYSDKACKFVPRDQTQHTPGSSNHCKDMLEFVDLLDIR